MDNRLTLSPQKPILGLVEDRLKARFAPRRLSGKLEGGHTYRQDGTSV